MYLIWSLNPVQNHSSPKHIFLQCETLRTSTSLSNDWMTTLAASFVPCLAYNSGAPLVSKFGCDISVGTPVRTDAGKDEGSPNASRQGKENVIFSWREITRCFRATSVAKRLFDSVEVKNLRKKHLISINGKKKFKRILSCLFGGRRKVQICLRGLHF